MTLLHPKEHLYRRMSATKFLYVKTVGDKVVRDSRAYSYLCKSSCWWTSSGTWKFVRNWPTPRKTPIANRCSLV